MIASRRNIGGIKLFPWKPCNQTKPWLRKWGGQCRRARCNLPFAVPTCAAVTIFDIYEFLRLLWPQIQPAQYNWPFWPLALPRNWIAQIWPYPDRNCDNFNKIFFARVTDRRWRRLHSAWGEVNRQRAGDGKRKDLLTGHIDYAPNKKAYTWRWVKKVQIEDRMVHILSLLAFGNIIRSLVVDRLPWKCLHLWYSGLENCSDNIL